MGSVIVDIMEGSTLAAEHKKLHPFFTAPKTLPSEPNSQPTTPATVSTASTTCSDTAKIQDRMGELEEPEVTPAKRKRRKAAEEGEEDWEDTKKPKRGRPKKIVQQGPSIMEHFSKANDEAKESNVALEEGGQKTTSAHVPQLQPDAPIAQNEVASHEDGKFGHGHVGDIKQAPPKKMLQFNPKTGTIGSPPKPKEPKFSKKPVKSEDTTEDTITPTRKGKRRSKRIATINYGLDDASRIRIGTKIDDILNEPTTAGPKPQTRPRISPRGQKKAENTDAKKSEETWKKDTHPFFTGKAKKLSADPASASEGVKEKSAPAPTRPRIFSSTPCSPRKPRPTVSSAALPQFGVRSLGLRTPGACHPLWPPKGMVHVRGGDDDAFTSPHPWGQIMAARKSKGNSTHITAEENLLNNFAFGLDLPKVLNTIRNTDTDNFRPPPAELRLPEKHFESGVKLEKRVLREIKNVNHPALAQLRSSLVSSLSAFDRYMCESACWAQKYTPRSAVEVLQYGKEAFLLRDWLEAMKVLSVDTGEVKVKAAKPPKKKRKKNKDDFIVDSDEEADNMDEVSEPEEDWSPDRRGVKKTVIRTGDIAAKDSKKPGRLSNTVVISGPHGCGKTSTVYAIAKELDFEVFEINSGSRRSGKDILEKIGDMTRNHLVQHDQTETSVAAIDEEEVAEDIKSGKQATMNSFFKPKAAPQPAKPPKTVKETPAPIKKESKKTSPKSQKQSLILLDEVDILYEEDKQFWNTVITLIAQSKRPFIMTCNDENLVPLQALSLHGVFRLSAPPTDLAIDRLLMIAACEGHALRRDAVSALYEARQRDLRACLMDLNCWCQVAVGASRGGIDWMLPRWPKGCDIDEDGNIVRVISQDTYTLGMGWLGHDVVSHSAEHGNTEHELLQQVVDFWQMDLANWHDSLDLPSWAGALDDTQDRLRLLKKYEDFTDSMSLADLSAVPVATSIREPIDCTLPELTQKTREDYIFGRQVLDAPVWSTYDPLATSLPITLKCLARENLRASLPGRPSHLNAMTESSVISMIRHHASTSPNDKALTRDDFSVAFDVLAISEKEANSTSSYLDPSVFDGTFRNITIDVAPYVRNIVAFEKELQKQRQKLSGLLSQGGTKRGRKTRAAHAALEGGSRSTVRREKWFDADLNGVLVMNTAGEGWADVVEDHHNGSRSASPVDPTARTARARRIVMDGHNDDDDSGSSGMDVD